MHPCLCRLSSNKIIFCLRLSYIYIMDNYRSRLIRYLKWYVVNDFFRPIRFLTESIIVLEKMKISSHVKPCRCSTFRSRLPAKMPTKSIIQVAMRMTLYSAISDPGMPQYWMSPLIFYEGPKFLHKSITWRVREGQGLSDCTKLCVLCIRIGNHGKSGKRILTRWLIDDTRWNNMDALPEFEAS